jgi:hypothetical protein
MLPIYQVFRTVHLLSIRQMHELFPDAAIKREILFGLTKSLIAYGMCNADRVCVGSIKSVR